MKTIQHMFALLLFSLFLLLPGAVQAAETVQPILSVSGYGNAQGAPDQAVITISVVNHAMDAETAQKENAVKASAIQNAIRKLGIEGQDIRTRNYSFYPTYQRDRGHENEISGYEANHSVIVTVNDLNLVGQVIDTALQSGANQISALDFHLRNTEKLRKTALTAALRDARSKADIIAQGLGKSIIGISHVSENTGNVGHRNYSMAMMAKADNMAERTPIEAGMLSLDATVNIDFILSN